MTSGVDDPAVGHGGRFDDQDSLAGGLDPAGVDQGGAGSKSQPIAGFGVDDAGGLIDDREPALADESAAGNGVVDIGQHGLAPAPAIRFSASLLINTWPPPVSVTAPLI